MVDADVERERRLLRGRKKSHKHSARKLPGKVLSAGQHPVDEPGVTERWPVRHYKLFMIGRIAGIIRVRLSGIALARFLDVDCVPRGSFAIERTFRTLHFHVANT